MMVTVKKLLVRWLILELIISLAVLALTPFLFGSIKPFKPQISSLKNASSVKINQPVAIALKKAAKKVASNETKIAKHSIKKTFIAKNNINNALKSAGKQKPQHIDEGQRVGILPGEDKDDAIIIN